MINKIKNFFQQEKTKKYLMYLVMFIFGALVVYGTTSVATEEFSGWVGRQRPTRTTPISTSGGGGGTSCNNTNCDILTKLQSVHDELGNSTWTLEGLGKYQTTIAGSHARDLQNIKDELGNSSWTLEGLAKYQTTIGSTLGLDLQAIKDELGHSSWTLDTIHLDLANKFDWVDRNIKSVHDELGSSSWTLEAIHRDLSNKFNTLAAHVTNNCQP